MELYAINTPMCKYDGGATFGVVPKSIWKKLMTADENNMLDAGMRCLLIVDGNKKLLIDTGIGTKLDDKQKRNFSYSDDKSLTDLLAEISISVDEITDVIFTHLHFDHVGGATIFNSNNQAEPLFKNAIHWVSIQQWENALNSNKREKASYHPENYMPLYESNLFKFIDKTTQITDNIELRITFGHTKGHIVPLINCNNRKLVFMGDFIPTVHHVSIPYVAAFDIDPVTAMEEKECFLNEAVKERYTLFFEHDPDNECATLQDTPKGVRIKDVISLNTFNKAIIP